MPDAFIGSRPFYDDPTRAGPFEQKLLQRHRAPRHHRRFVMSGGGWNHSRRAAR